MSEYQKHKEPILKVIGKDGPIWKEMQKPQIMYVPVRDYGVRKLYARLEKRSSVHK